MHLTDYLVLLIPRWVYAAEGKPIQLVQFDKLSFKFSIL